MRKQNHLTTGTPLNAEFMNLHDSGNGLYRFRFFVFDEAKNESECYCSNETFTLEEARFQHFGGKNPIVGKNNHWQIVLGWNARKPDTQTVLQFRKHPDGFFNKSPAYIAHHEAWQGCKNGERPTPEKVAYLQNRRKTDTRFLMLETIGLIARLGVTGKLDENLYPLFFKCSRAELKAHIAKTFKPGMDWGNHGKAWHIDHIKPKSRYTLDDCFSANYYWNLRALSPEENLAKNCNLN